MINANELRIENYVHRKFLNPDPKGENIGHTVCQVKAIGVETVHTSEKIGRNGIIKGFYDNFEPIPLTEEWLLKFGLIESQDVEGDTVWNNEKIEIEFFNFANENSSFYVVRALLFQTEIELKFVHQLQNLYFALTGKELQCLS